MSNDKTCNICYNKNINTNLNCKTCKNCVCDTCYANIIYTHDKFLYNFVEDKSILKCAFCKSENIFSTKINNFDTNNRLIKLSLKTIHDNNIEFNNLVDDLNILRSKYFEISSKNDEIVYQNKSLKMQLKVEEPKNDKLEQIKQLMKQTKNKNTILYKQIEDILVNKFLL